MTPHHGMQIARTWSSGDTLSLVLGLRYWVRQLPEARPEYSGLTALMMGPFVMAGLTHDTRWLELEAVGRYRCL